MEYSFESNEKAIRAKALWYTVIINLILLGGLILATSPQMVEKFKSLWQNEQPAVEQPVANGPQA
ncbi:MAG: hypothetical protein KDC57_04265 [Saprospiraceae bacterium]|nr:hypothetical protein [Saprospiraceae bacterium]